MHSYSGEDRHRRRLFVPYLCPEDVSHRFSVQQSEVEEMALEHDTLRDIGHSTYECHAPQSGNVTAKPAVRITRNTARHNYEGHVALRSINDADWRLINSPRLAFVESADQGGAKGRRPSRLPWGRRGRRGG